MHGALTVRRPQDAGVCAMNDLPAIATEPAPGAASDRAAAEEARRGSRAAFCRLHDRYARVVHGVLLSRVPLQDADDLVQEVFLHAWKRIGGLRNPDAVGPWLMRITRNISVRYYRRRRRAHDLPDGVPCGAGSDGSIPEEAARALAAIGTLPPAYRETLLLRLVEGLTGPEIADRTGLTAGSVRVNLHRGMHELRRRLARPATSETSP